MLKQSTNRLLLLQELQKFSQGVQSENQKFYHKLLRKEFEVRFIYLSSIRICFYLVSSRTIEICFRTI
jgi:uncharacterized membrane protein YsdA (DUF1294 family)